MTHECRVVATDHASINVDHDDVVIALRWSGVAEGMGVRRVRLA